jgi:hypothetical protein
MYFLYCSFLSGHIWLCISKMICKAGEDAPITFKITENAEQLK